MTETATADLTVSIDQDAVDRLFCDARTASHFTDAPVTDEQKRAIYELTKMGPTAFNSQPMRITWVESPEARERLVKHMSRGNQEKTRNAPLTAILSYDENWHEHFPEFLPAAPHMKGMYDENDDMRITSGKANSHIQVGYFIIAARTAGLAAGPMTGFNPAGVDEEFFEGTGKHSIVVVNLGTPVEPEYARNPRFDAEDVTETI
ncbi:malonic semialdehyde reductase [Kocuria carniphila]|uniref:malonic semialdehyde reductase n=1 Tax=Kocuria carniphila TaxID=262208 RepID=UPI0021A39813|nr:malonic semialdehyde reductase [Kocuria carniphila]MCT1803775.1 malonic semialdehyde reductase [Kocuria carniphila]